MRDGLLHKVCRNGKRRFHFILFNDAIAYGTEAVLKKNQYKYGDQSQRTELSQES
jgi:hypothetical protein